MEPQYKEMSEIKIPIDNEGRMLINFMGAFGTGALIQPIKSFLTEVSTNWPIGLFHLMSQPGLSLQEG